MRHRDCTTRARDTAEERPGRGLVGITRQSNRLSFEQWAAADKSAQLPLAVAAIAPAGLGGCLRLPALILGQRTAALVHFLESTAARAPCEEVAGLILH